ncbi:putative FAR1 DNA-binding domain-containing protein, partial [Homarus americanus]
VYVLFQISLQGMEEIILKDEPEDWCSVVEDTRQRDPNVLYCNNSDQVSQRCLSSDGWNFSSLVEENPSYSLAFDRTLFPKDYPGGFHKTSVTSLMPSDMIQVGDKFSSLAKLEQAITLYEAETMTKLYKRDSRKLVSKRVQRDIKAELVYYDLVYACVKGGRIYYTRGRPSRNSLKSGCTMQIRLKASRDGQFLEVVHKVEQHNHSLTETHMSYRGYVVSLTLYHHHYKTFMCCQPHTLPSPPL